MRSTPEITPFRQMISARFLGDNPTVEYLDQLLPHQWLQANPQHAWRIQQLRQQADA